MVKDRTEAGNPETRDEAADMSFEDAIAKLETIVSQLESGDVPLEQAISLFQEGVKLSRLCGEKLEQVERKIEMLIETDGGIARKPFVPPEEEGERE